VDETAVASETAGKTVGETDVETCEVVECDNKNGNGMAIGGRRRRAWLAVRLYVPVFLLMLLLRAPFPVEQGE
jgi:hypothetical protein